MVLTKRGEATSAYLRDLRSKRADEIAVGEKIRIDAGPFTKGGFAAVESITRNDDGTITIRTATCGLLHNSPEEKFRVAQNAEQMASTWAAAMAYQDSLTKAGAVRKRAKKPVAEAKRESGTI